MSKQIIATFLITAIIFSIFGIFLDAKTNIARNVFKIKSSTEQKMASTGTDTFQSGWDAAKKRLQESGQYFVMPGEIKSVSGQITDVLNNKITLKIRPVEPLDDPELDNRIVAITDSTKIYQMVQKDQAQYQKEIDEFNKKMQEQMKSPEKMISPIISPELFIKKEVAISDLKADQQITVSSDDNIRNAKEFKAVEIQIQATMPIPEMPPMAPLTSPTGM